MDTNLNAYEIAQLMIKIGEYAKEYTAGARQRVQSGQSDYISEIIESDALYRLAREIMDNREFDSKDLPELVKAFFRLAVSELLLQKEVKDDVHSYLQSRFGLEESLENLSASNNLAGDQLAAKHQDNLAHIVADIIESRTPETQTGIAADAAFAANLAAIKLGKGNAQEGFKKIDQIMIDAFIIVNMAVTAQTSEQASDEIKDLVRGIAGQTINLKLLPAD